MSALQLLDGLDVDEIRARLMVETSDALALADELAVATQTDVSLPVRQRIAANYDQVRSRMRSLRSLLRAEEGSC